MKKFKGKPLKLLEEFESLVNNMTDDELNKDSSLEFTNNRTIAQNSLLSSMIRELMDFTGEENFERMKKIVKRELGFFQIHKVEGVDSDYETIIYDKTSEMGTKQLADFILKLEAWALNTLNYTFESTQSNKNKKTKW